MPNSGLVKETKQSIKTLSSTCKKYANVLPIQTCGTKTNHRPRPYLEYILPPSLISGKFVVAGKWGGSMSSVRLSITDIAVLSEYSVSTISTFPLNVRK